MATNLKCIDKNTGFFPTAKGTWNTAPSSYGWLSPTLHKDFGWGSTPQSDFTTTSPQSKGIFIYVSRPLQGTGTLTGTLDLVNVVNVSNAAMDAFWKVHAWISVGDTNVVRGTLINNYEENTTNEWPVTSTAIGLQAPVALSSVAWQEGDRIILELGWIARNVVSTVYVGRLFRGACSTDYPYPFLSAASVGDTFASSPGPADLKYNHVTLSQTLTFLEEPTIPEPPANDRCSTATIVSAVPYTSPIINAKEANQGDQMQASCGSGGNDGAAIWWKWTPAVSEDATFDADPSFDVAPVISVWTGTCGSLTEVACNSDSTPAITMPVTAGTPYFIQFARSGSQTGGTTWGLRIATTGGSLPLDAGTAVATAKTATSVTLNDFTVDGGTAPYTYQWHRSLTSGFTPDGTTALAGGTTLPFTDATTTLGTTYYYKLVVTDDVAATDTTPELAVTVTQPAKPVATASIFVPATFDLVNPLKTTISWTHDDVGVTAFEVQQCTGAGCTSFTTLSSGIAPPTHALNVGPTGYAENTVYRFRVRALSADVNSEWSDVVNYTTGTTGTTSTSSDNGGAGWFWPGEAVASGGVARWDMVVFDFPGLAPNQVLTGVRLDFCAWKDLPPPGGLDEGGLLYPVGTPTTFDKSSYGGSTNPSPYYVNPLAEEPDTDCVHDLGGFSGGIPVGTYDTATGGDQQLPAAANKLDPVASQADGAARKYGWYGLRVNNNLPGFPPQEFESVMVTSFTMHVDYATLPEALTEPPGEPIPVDADSECCCSCPTGGGGVSEPPPDDPLVPGETITCAGGGVGPIGDTPAPSIIWL